MKKSWRYILATIAAATILLAACGGTVPQQPSAQPADILDDDATGLADSQPTPNGDPNETAPDENSEAAPTELTLSINSEQSEARFLIDEVLLGQDKTVVGTTNDVSGTITPDFDAPDQTSVGTFTVDLSTLATDDNNRTRTLHGRILETGQDQYRFATFETTELSSLPESISFGEPFSFQLTGDLTIHGVTLEKTFDITATAVSESRIEGLASLGITYPEFNVQILRLPQQVASVDEDVILELEFVAEAG